MALTKDMEQTYKRFGLYIDQLRQVMSKHGIQGTGWRTYTKFATVIKNNKAARVEIGNLLRVVAALDGGKGAMGTIGLVVALSIGGVGVAAMGSAFGIPAAAITFLGTICGGLIGNELDGTGTTAKVLTNAGIAPSTINLDSSDVLYLASSAGENFAKDTFRESLAKAGKMMASELKPAQILLFS